MKKSKNNILKDFTSGKLLFHCKNKAIFKLEGSDSYKFLNGISTNEIKYNGAPNSINTLVLTIKGRILFDIEIYSYSNDILFLVFNLSQKDDLIEYLKKYRMSYKIDISDLSSSFKVFKGNIQNIKSEIIKFESPQIVENFKVYFFPINQNSYNNLITHNEKDYNIWKILHGIPSYPNEITSKTIPIEAHMWSAISFTKGCYIGQETIARIHYRGKVKRTLACIKIPGFINNDKDIINDKNELIGVICNEYYFEDEGATYALGYINTQENYDNNNVIVNNINSIILKNEYKMRNEELLVNNKK